MNATSASPASTAAATPPRPSAFEKLFGEYFDCPHFPARVPLLRDGVERERHVVTIVGGGPTGLTLALGLAGFGVRSVLIESDPSICTGSRAGAFIRRTLEILERVGVAQKAIGSGLAWYTGWTFHGQKEIARLQIPHDENQKFSPAISQLQNRIEWLMVQAAAWRADRHPLAVAGRGHYAKRQQGRAQHHHTGWQLPPAQRLGGGLRWRTEHAAPAA